jgi:hypothetical protein
MTDRISYNDILQVSVVDFVNAKTQIEAYCLENDFQRLKEKLVNILHLACFKEEAPPLLLNPDRNPTVNTSGPTNFHQRSAFRYNRKSTTHHGHYPNNNHITHNAPSHNQIKRQFLGTNSNKEVIGYLNKLSKNNFEIITQKLLRHCFQKSTITEVIKLIIEKIHKHQCYGDMYTVLLREFSTRYQDATKEVICNFIDISLEALPKLISDISIEPPVCDYDAYCYFIKLREHVFAQFSTILMIDFAFSNCKKHNLIFELLKQQITCADTLSTIQLCTEMLQKYVSTYHSILVEDTDIIEHLFYNMYSHVVAKFGTLPRKIEFGWEDMLKVIRTCS